MNCRKIQDLILTDFTDNEASDDVRRLVEGHLAACSACRAFQAEVRQNAVRPLQEAERVEAPARLWSRVTSEIFAQQLKPAPAGVLEKLKNLVAAPRPAFAFSTVAALVIFGILAARLPYLSGRAERQQLAEAAIEEQIDYFANGNGGEVTDTFKTDVEEFFS